MAKQKSKLGRGIGVLLGEQNLVVPGGQAYPTPVDNEEQEVSVRSELVQEIPLTQIEVNPAQPRTNFDPESLNELAESIKRLGIIQPITVRLLAPERYQIISGERRYRASTLAGLEAVPAYIRTADDQGLMEMAVVENIQREDLNAIEIALSFQYLVNEHGLTQEELSNRVGKKRSSVANYLRLLKLPEEIQLAIKEHAFSFGHARALINISDAQEQKNIAKKIIQQDLSVRQTEELVKNLLNPQENQKKEHAPTVESNDEKSEIFVLLAESIERNFKGNVSIKTGAKGGAKLTIDIKTDDDMLYIIDRLTRLEKL